MKANAAPMNLQPEYFVQMRRAWQCVSQQPWLSVAFVCYWLWVNMAYQMPLAFPNTQLVDGMDIPARLFPISVSVVTYLGLSVWYKLSASVIRQAWYPILLVSIMSIGSLLTVFWVAFGSASMLLLLSSSVLVGVSSACLCIEMQRVFGQLGSQYVLLIGCFAVLLSSLLINFLLHCPLLLQQIVWTLSPLPIAFGVQQTVKKIAAKGYYTHGLGTKLYIPYRFLITALLHGMTIGITLGISFFYSVDEGTSPPIAISYALSAILLFCITIFFHLDYNHLIYRIGFPLAALGLLLITCSIGLLRMGVLIQLLGFSFLHLVMWGVCTFFIKNLKLPATWVIATSTFAFMCGQLLGGIISTLIDSLPQAAQAMQTSTAVMLFILLFASLLLMSGSNLKTGWGLARFGSNELFDSDSEQTVAEIAIEHNLTKREAETLALLIRGKNRKSVSTELFISEETVKSHSRSIYAKVSVHSQQELISLFDERLMKIRLEVPTDARIEATEDAEC
jgi:DNA-binding CsgD family transcriptional regulator